MRFEVTKEETPAECLVDKMMLLRWGRPLSRAWRRADGLRTFCTADEDKYLELKQLKDIKRCDYYGGEAQSNGVLTVLWSAATSSTSCKARSEDTFTMWTCRWERNN